MIEERKPRNAKPIDAIKMPPHSLEAEQAVLGGLMLDNNAWDKIADRLIDNDFYRIEHQLIFRTLAELAQRSQPFDVLTVAESLKSNAHLDQAGGEVYLFELAKNTPSAANISAYADIVRQRSVLRQLATAGAEVADLAFYPDGRECSEILDLAEHKIFRIAEQTNRGSGLEPIHFSVQATVDHVDTRSQADGPITGLATGYIEFDKMTTGLQKGDLIIIAGRPSMGKTAFAVNIAEYVMLSQRQVKKKPVAIFSLEMSKQQITARMLASQSRINQQKIRTGELDKQEWECFHSAASLIAQAPCLIDDTPALTPTELRARARRAAREHGELSLIVVDFLQLMHVPGTKENRATEIFEISRSLKALAKELNVPVIAAAQLNRGVENRPDKRPLMSDLRESGAIEQDADLIALIYRDTMYNKGLLGIEKNKAEIIIAKHRNGETGMFHLTYLSELTRFENYISSEFFDR